MPPQWPPRSRLAAIRALPYQKSNVRTVFVFGLVVLLLVTLSVVTTTRRGGRPLPVKTVGAADTLGDAVAPNAKEVLEANGEGQLGWLHERMRLQLEIETLKSEMARRRQDESDAPHEIAKATPSPTAVSTAHTAALDDDLWLVVGIPTVPRKREALINEGSQGDNFVLRRTLWSYLAPLAAVDGGLAQRFRVLVVNNRPRAHRAFEAAKREFSQLHAHHYYGAAAKCFEFIDTDHTYPDEAAPGSGGGDGHEPPTPAVRRQSLDVVALLDVAVKRPSKYFLFTEDDFELCPNGLLALQYALSKARRYTQAPEPSPVHQRTTADDREVHEPFTALRCGIGLNGIVMHNRGPYRDVARFREYLFRHYARRPPDHLVVEFYAQETKEAETHFGGVDKRHVAAFRHNIFRHLGGRLSTLRDETAWSTPPCFTELITPQVFEVEAWNPQQCPRDDVWPCNSDEAHREQSAAGGGVVLRWNVSSESAVSQHWVASKD